MKLYENKAGIETEIGEYEFSFWPGHLKQCIDIIRKQMDYLEKAVPDDEKRVVS